MANRSLNRVILIGNLTRDPELRYTPQGTPVCSFGLATSRSWTTSDGERKEETQFHRIVAWNKLAELCGQLLSKGQRVYVEGRITYRSYEDKDGVEKSVTEIVLDDFIAFSGSKSTKNNEDKKQDQQEEKEDQKKDENEEKKEEEKSGENEEELNPDDIPF